MKDRFAIRRADKSDLPRILKLYAQPGIDDGKVLSAAEAERIFAIFNQYPNYTIYVAELESRIVGTFALLIMDNLGHMGAPSAIIEHVAVAPDLQRRGIGKAMMQHALDVAKEHGCYKAMLSSNLKRDVAHQFYESLDFDRHGYSFSVDT